MRRSASALAFLALILLSANPAAADYDGEMHQEGIDTRLTGAALDRAKNGLDLKTGKADPHSYAYTSQRAARLQQLVPPGMSLPEWFILHHRAVSTVIPGMRRLEHVRANLGVSGGVPLTEEQLASLRPHGWDRTPTWWSM